MDFVAAQAEVGGRDLGVGIINASAGAITAVRNFTPFLRPIVFIGEATAAWQAR